MKTFLLEDGDLVLGSGSFQEVTGAPKLRQDLGIAMREPLRCDRFHPRWGSILPNLVGEPITDALVTQIDAEVRRIIDNTSLVQRDKITRDRANRVRPRYDSGEIIDSIKGVQVRPDWDRVHVRALIRTLTADEAVVLTVRG